MQIYISHNENSVSMFSIAFHVLEILNVYIDLGQKKKSVDVPKFLQIDILDMVPSGTSGSTLVSPVRSCLQRCYWGSV